MNKLEQLPEFQQILDVQSAYLRIPLHELEEKRGEITETRYARGALMIHRGYYCPSLIQDIVIGNARRGRLIRHPRKEPAPEYTYGFDREGRLICAETEFNSEWIFYEEGRRQIGLTFFKRNASLDAVSVCSWDDRDRLTSYVYGYSYIIEKKPTLIWSEQYQYGEDRMIVTTSDYFQNNKGKLMARSWGYDFTLENGVIKSYYSLQDAVQREVPKRITRNVFHGIGLY